MMQTQTQPLPTCEEYDPLEAHLDELEGSGADFLQDFIMPQQQAGGADTPLSNSNGYTSEESDYSVTTSSDEQKYRDMSFLQTANTSELVDVVASGFPASSLSTPTPEQQQQPQKFVGKVIKGKTSKYRGVTQTSKTSWGAKYSAKRITNTCKTPEEAAHAYDEYLKTNYPQKYAKFANFCGKCGNFVNPLGLPQFQSECLCSGSAVNTGAGSSTLTSSAAVGPPSLASVSPKKEVFSRQQITTPTATSALAPPTAPSPAVGPSTAPPRAALAMMGSSTHSLDCPNPAEEDDVAALSRNSNLSVGSLKFSFSDDTEQFFDESFNDVAKLSGSVPPGATAEGLQVQPQQQQFSGDGDAAMGSQYQKRDSLPMAVISSVVDSFTQEDNLDQIIKDINRSSSLHSLGKMDVDDTAMIEHLGGESVRSFTATCSSSGSGNPLGSFQLEATSVNSTFVDFSADELQDLSEYFLSEHDAGAVVQHELQSNGQGPSATVVKNDVNPVFKKNHSLDFDTEDSAMTGSSRGLDVVKLEGGDMHAISSFMQPPQPGMGVMAGANGAVGLVVPAGLPPPAMIEIQTPFLEKYWRNDRKNIQCFPYCPEHGNYYRVRIENLQHHCKGVCRAAVKAHIMIPMPAGSPALQAGMMVLARCNSTFSRNEVFTAQRSLSIPEMQSLQAVSTLGVTSNFAPLNNGLPGVQFDVTFHPDVWKFEFDLPKKRRHVQSAASSNPATASYAAYDGIDAAGGDHLGSEFLYFFEIDVFHSLDKVVFERLGHTESTNFQIGNTRTLLRQRNKMVEDLNNNDCPLIQLGHSDSDKLADNDDMPQKKKIKVPRGQRRIPSFNDDGSMVVSSRGFSGPDKMSVGYITGEGTSSASKKNLLDPEAPLDLDGYFRADSKDSIFDAEPGSSDLSQVEDDVWKDVDSDDQQQAATADYRQYVSPKPKRGNPTDVQTANPPAPVVVSKTHEYSHPEARSVGSSSPAEPHSLPKLLGYSFVCVPLSVMFVPVGLLLLLAFVLLPPAASGIVRTLDALSDMELSRANSSRTSSDSRMVLNRLEKAGDGKPQGGMFRYHGKGAVWGRLAYFACAKLVVSLVVLVPTLMLGLLAGLTFPIRPASSALAKAACQCALWSREYTRESTGKPPSPAAAHYEEQDGLV